MADIVCPRCRQVDLVRLETVIKGAVGYKHFYCGRCDHTWRSAGVPHGTDSLDHADDKPEPSRPAKDAT